MRIREAFVRTSSHSFLTPKLPETPHPQLKPGNVLLRGCRNDRRGFCALVSDFGLSKVGWAAGGSNRRAARVHTCKCTGVLGGWRAGL